MQQLNSKFKQMGVHKLSQMQVGEYGDTVEE